jgi:hypothetical protein
MVEEERDEGQSLQDFLHLVSKILKLDYKGYRKRSNNMPKL